MLGELQPWFSGWPSFECFRREMDDLFDRFFGESGHRGWDTSMLTWPVTESFFRDGHWVIRLDLPGVEPKDIEVSVAGDTLTVRASREVRKNDSQDSESREVSYRRFERSLTLPKGVNSGEIKANYQHGVLELTMPASPEISGRKIPVAIGEEKKQIQQHAA